MNEYFLLMAQYDAKVVIPVSLVVKDYFPHLSVDKFMRKVSLGEIAIPLIRMDSGSQKAAKGVHVADLANYIHNRRAAAIKAVRQRVRPGVEIGDAIVGAF